MSDNVGAGATLLAGGGNDGNSGSDGGDKGKEGGGSEITKQSGGAPGANDTGDNSNGDGGSSNNAGDGGDPPWYQSLDPEQAVFAQKQGWKSPSAALKSHELLSRKLAGATDIIAIPGADATDEQKAEYNRRLNVPNDVADYKFTFPDGAKVDPGILENWAQVAKDQGLRADQANAAANFLVEQSAKGAKQVEADWKTENDQAAVDFQKEKGDNWNEFASVAQQGANALGLSAEEMNKIERAVGVKTLMTMMNNLGGRVKEGSMVGLNEGGDITRGMTPEMAEIKLREMKTKGSESYNALINPQHSGHLAAQAERLSYIKIITGET